MPQLVDLADRLELFVDDWLIDRLHGLDRRLATPVPREVALVTDAPWEGNNAMFITVLQDGDAWRMYYRGRGFDLTGDRITYTHPQVTCMAVSDDGIRWERPELGLYEFDGSTRNNIVWTGRGTHNFSPFIDANPACPPEARYKAVGGVKGRDVDDPDTEDGMYGFQSPDGVHWTMIRPDPLITQGAFDSHNLVFYDPHIGRYRAYLRDGRNGRDIRTAQSDDFANWSESPRFLTYRTGRHTELYTNQIMPYPRAPHILLGFPARYVAGRGHVTPLNERISRIQPRYGLDYSDAGFMSSRDGERFDLWDEALIRPGPVAQGRWVYGAGFPAWGLIPTPAAPPPASVASWLGDAPNMELSLYACEGGWVGDSLQIRRYSLRVDGFVAVHAPGRGGEMLTRPFTFQGSRLRLNLATSAAGGARVEIQDAATGRAVPGLELESCPVLFGDALDMPVAWETQPDLAQLAGKPVRLRIEMRDADLYALQFTA